MRLGLIPFVSLSLLAVACEKAPPAATPTGEAVAVGQPVPQAAPLPTPAPIPSAGQLPPGHPPVGGVPAGHPPMGGVPAGHPPMGQGRPAANPMGDSAAEQGVELPLILEGSGSLAELKARLALVDDATLHPALEEGFRKVFTIARASRDNARATALLEPLAAHADKKVAAFAERTLGYVRINSGFDSEGAKARYIKALELDPDYGEAHYALAFTLAISDLTQGKEHFEKAMALGVPDTRQLRTQFYRE